MLIWWGAIGLIDPISPEPQWGSIKNIVIKRSELIEKMLEIAFFLIAHF